MNKIEKLQIARTQLYDGFEPGVEGIQVNIEKFGSFQIKIANLTSLEKLEQILGAVAFQNVIYESNFTTSSLFKEYRSRNALACYYIDIMHDLDSYILIISYGETQPARYKLFLESIWKLDKGTFHS